MLRNRVKRFVVNQMVMQQALFGFDIKWTKVTDLCFSYKEAVYNLQLLERSDKFSGAINNYRISAFYI